MMTWLRRIAPALLLLVLAPLTAEFLLGDFSVRRLLGDRAHPGRPGPDAELGARLPAWPSVRRGRGRPEPAGRAGRA